MTRDTKLADSHKASGTIVNTTIDLIEEVGFERVSMRKVAEAFGIQAASLYWYVESRDTLLDRVAEEIYQRLASLVDHRLAGVGVGEVKQCLLIVRSYLLNHNGNAEALSTRTVGGPGYCLLVEHLTRALRTQGVIGAAAVNGGLALLAYTLGSVLTQKAPLATRLPTSADFRHILAEQTEAPLVAEHAGIIASPDHTIRFASGLDAMLIGFGVTP